MPVTANPERRSSRMPKWWSCLPTVKSCTLSTPTVMTVGCEGLAVQATPSNALLEPEKKLKQRWKMRERMRGKTRERVKEREGERERERYLERYTKRDRERERRRNEGREREGY